MSNKDIADHLLELHKLNPDEQLERCADFFSTEMSKVIHVLKGMRKVNKQKHQELIGIIVGSLIFSTTGSIDESLAVNDFIHEKVKKDLAHVDSLYTKRK